MTYQKNIISNSNIYTGGGHFVNGDNNFVLEILYNAENKSEKIKNFVNQSKNVLNKIQSDIAGIVLNRDLIDLPQKEILNNNQFIFLDGVAGTGKSAYAKVILQSINDTCIVSFAADQFLKPTLSNTLTDSNIDGSIEDLFAEFPEFPNKLIYIDSFEKLLEGDGDAFRELLLILKDNQNIKLMLSCRTYALEILKLNYFEVEQLHNSKTIKVPKLQDDELDFFIEKIPELKYIVENDKLRELLRIPKYLSLAHKLISIADIDYSKMDQTEFKEKLWMNVVGGKNKHKRCKTLIDVTVKRAKSLSLVTSVSEFDLDTIHSLNSDGILYEENQRYAPSHDIFEDWGLIKYIDSIYNDSQDCINFYSILTSEPAIRRGFRLWTESKIEEYSGWIYNFIIETIQTEQIENYWKDEIVTAILKSGICFKYFRDNEDELLENNGELLLKFINLLRISGKDSNHVPNNFGWDVVIAFLYNQRTNIETIRIQTVRLLLDWQQILNDKKENRDTARFTGLLLYWILENDIGIEKELDSGNYSIRDQSIRLLYRLSGYIPAEIRTILDKIINKAKLGELDDDQIEITYALSHFYSGTLPDFFPDDLITLASYVWKIDSDDDYSGTNKNSHFGLISGYDFSYSPHGVYQTFIYNLLHFHPWKALDFIIDITNYCATKYADSEYLKRRRFGGDPDEMFKVKLLYNNREYQLLGSKYLWSINRGGLYAIPDLLQSIVVSLEKYLYELGKIEHKEINSILQQFFDKIYTNSTNVILLSVVSSITMAYPFKIGDKFLPLLSTKHFFDWDRERWFSDYSERSFSGIYSNDFVGRKCNDERVESMRLKHRLQYQNGLSGFLLWYQLSNKIFNERIFERIDDLEKKGDNHDVYFLKFLTEIDSRNQKITKTEYDGHYHTLQIEPDYERNSSLSKEMKKNAEEKKIIDENSSYNLWVIQTYKMPENNTETFDYWQECLEYYNSGHGKNSHLDFFNINIFPYGTLAALGLELFSDQLNDNEFNFCVGTIIDMAESFYDKIKNREEFSFSEDFTRISVHDYDAVYISLPKLLIYTDRLTEEQKSYIKDLIFIFLRDVSSKDDNHIKKLYQSFKDNVWKLDYQFAFNSFIALISYAKLKKKWGKSRQFTEEEKIKVNNEEEAILNFVSNNCDTLKIDHLTYNDYLSTELEKVLEIFPLKEYDFSYDFLKILFEAQFDSYGVKSKNMYRREYNFEVEILLKYKMIPFLLNNYSDRSEAFFTNIIKQDFSNIGKEKAEFVKNIVGWFALEIDKNSGDISQKESFWKYWKILFNEVKNDQHFLISEFLLFSDIWRDNADNWAILEDNGIADNFYIMISKLTYVKPEYLLQLFSGIGFQTLMPNGIFALMKHVRNQNLLILTGNSYFYGDKLIMKMFKDKFKSIKENRKFLSDFLEFLDIMISSGSSNAYYIRENLILYKREVV